MKKLIYGASILAAFPVPATAQNADADASSVSAITDEIIVTAQRREEKIQDVPISMVAVGARELATKGITTLDSIQQLAPGMTMSTIGSGWVSYTYVRGSGTNQVEAGSDPSVAFFIDEIYLGGSGGLQFDLIDIERIEVLKGPQGTLFGRNASAGAISVITRRPSTSFEATGTVGVGNYGSFHARAGLSGPLGGGLLYRVAAGYRTRNAYTDNPAGRDPGDLDSIGGRGQLEWRGDTVSVLLTADGYRARNGMTNQFLSTAFKGAILSPTAIAALPAGSFYRNSYDVEGFENQDTYSFSGRVEADTSIGQIVSISAYRHNKFNRLQDQEGSLAAGYKLTTSEKDRTFSQELRLASDVTDQLRTIFGLYYYHATIGQSVALATGSDFAVAPFRNRTGTDVATIKTDSYAAFGQASYDITPALTLTVGGRYTVDKKSNQRAVTGLSPAALPYTASLSPTFKSFDPMVGLDWKPAPDVLVYASYRQGFKSGGFQTLLPPSKAVAETPFNAEHVTSYEVGLKSQWLDNRLTFNLALFRADIGDQQVSQILGPALIVIQNAGETRTDGFDLSVTLRPSDRIRFRGDLTMQKAQFKRYDGGTVNYTGNRMLRSPDVQGTVGLDYTLPVAGGEMKASGEYSFRSKQYFDASNPHKPGEYQPDYGLANAYLTFSPKGDTIEARLFAKNIGGKKYFKNVVVVNSAAGITGVGTPGEPFTFGGSISFKY